MSGSSLLPPLSMRRNETQRRIAAQRVAVSAAWTDFAHAEGRGQAKVLRAVIWMRRGFAVTAMVAAAMATRRLVRQGGARGLISVLTLARGIRRLLIAFRQASSLQN